MAANWQSNITQFLACELTGTKVKKKMLLHSDEPIFTVVYKKEKTEKGSP